VSPAQLIRVSEDSELWYHMVANVVYDGTARHPRKKSFSAFTLLVEGLQKGHVETAAAIYKGSVVGSKPNLE